MKVNPEVALAIEEITSAFPSAEVAVKVEPDGGAWVTVDTVDLGERWEPRRSWIGFRIADGYPYADVYPHFVDGAVHLADGMPFPEGVSGGHAYAVDGRACVQLSRRSNRLNPATDTAALKLVKVLDWMRG